MFRILLTVVQVFSAFAIIGLVLLQRGKGADAGAGFGAGASGTMFGARGASTALSRATAIFAAVFMINSLALAYMGTKQVDQPKTILDQAVESAPKTPVGTVNSVAPAPGSAATAPSTQSNAAQPAPAAPAPSAPAPTAPRAGADTSSSSSPAPAAEPAPTPKGEGSAPPPK
jgi:preprotein translocase subunit SecG